jgi:hypothetical protein
VGEQSDVGRKRLFWACIRIAFILSAGLLWFAEHQEVKAEHQKVSELSVALDKERNDSLPKLSGFIDQKVWGYDPKTQEVGIMAIVGIKNLGSPSIAQGFRLRLTLPNGTRVEYGSSFIPDGYKVYTMQRPPSVSHVATFTHSMALEEKTSSPILKGAVVRGGLRFQIKNILPEQIGSNFAKWEVLFIDVLDNECVAIDKTTDGGVLRYPGVDQPFAPNVK